MAEDYRGTIKYHLEQIEMQIGSYERGRQDPGSVLGFVGEVEFQLNSLKELAETWQEEIDEQEYQEELEEEDNRPPSWLAPTNEDEEG